MTRRELLGRSAGVIAATALFGGETAAAASSPQKQKPNIVVFMTDDQRADDMWMLSRTRQLLGGEGTTFMNAFTTSPQCAPSRATYFTGLLAHNHGLISNTSKIGDVDFSHSLGVLLQAAGYFTSHVGKVLLNDAATFRLPGFDDWFALATPGEYTDFDITVNDNGTVRTFNGTDNYQSDVLAAHAVDIIKRVGNSAQPLFMTVAPSIPHDQVHGSQQLPPQPATRYAGSFAQLPLPEPPNFNENDVSDKPQEVQNLSVLTDDQVAAIQAEYRARSAALLAIDDNVESIYNALRDAGRLDNTIFVFTADHGWMQGEHRYPGGKVVHYEPSTRIPLLIRGPGFPANSVCEELVANVDIPATLIQAAGAQPAQPPDGVPLLPMPPQPDDRVLPLEIQFDGGGGAYANPSHYCAARTRDWKYVLHPDTNEEELYDVRNDPYELTNLATDPAHNARKATLRGEATSLSTCQGDTCRRYLG